MFYNWANLFLRALEDLPVIKIIFAEYKTVSVQISQNQMDEIYRPFLMYCRKDGGKSSAIIQRSKNTAMQSKIISLQYNG